MALRACAVLFIALALCGNAAVASAQSSESGSGSLGSGSLGSSSLDSGSSGSGSLGSGSLGSGSSEPAAPEPAAELATDSAGNPVVAITQAQLDSALTCTGDLANATKDPVLLSAAFSTDQQSFGYNYLKSLPALGHPVCSLSYTDGGFGDLQVSAQYVVEAVRMMSSVSGRKVVLMGHQHGPLVNMWALKFWSDLPPLVSDVISLATPYNGTDSARMGCDTSGKCPTANWQIATGSKFLAALNSRPLPVGPSYTSIYTQFDELIYPQPFSSTLTGGTTIAVQDVCPLRPVEHFLILGDNVAYNIVVDALDHDGPAVTSRISKNLCFTAASPGVNFLDPGLSPLTGLGYLKDTAVKGFAELTSTEPEVAAYARS